MTRPRVWLVTHARDWSYDFNARAVASELADRFDCRIAYSGLRAADLLAWRPDLAVEFWWKGRTRRLLPEIPVLKQVSSHRWQQERYGELTAYQLVRKHLERADGVLVPSVRLEVDLVAAGAPHVRIAPKGFDPKLFGREIDRTGDLRIGWAGKASAPDKRLALLREACPSLRVAGGALPRARMNRFYNRLDVLAIASDAEGDPLTLIEAMACGCFPVATDVGIVSELVEHGVNGLIVEQSVEAFRDAFAWCRDHRDLVRDAGAANAERMRATRTWSATAPAWGDAFDAALARRG